MGFGTFHLHLLDIPDVQRGVGLCIALQTPGGHTWLYDTGTGYPDGSGGWEGGCNSGRDQVLPWMQERGIGKLDGVIISHAHYDHFGGLLWLADSVPIDRLIDSGYEFSGWRDDHYNTELQDYSRLRERFRDHGAWQPAIAGDVLDLDDRLQVKVIAPPPGFFSDPDPQSRPEANPAAHYMLNTNSLMLKIRHGVTEFLLPGDIEHQDQGRLLVPSVAPEDLACDVLVAPGHGLHTDPTFAAAAHPKVTVVSLFSRWLSSCTAIEGFSAVGSEVYVTGRDGGIEVVSDGTGVRVRCGGAE